MEKYSHGAFQIAGYKITTTKKDGQDTGDILAAWKKFMGDKMADKIMHKTYPSLHTVYYNYVTPEKLDERSYDMLIGYIVEENSTQDTKTFTTITIPPQDYEYVKVTGEMPKNLIAEWHKVNAMSNKEFNRAFGYDMDMYNQDMTEVTLTVSVGK